MVVVLISLLLLLGIGGWIFYSKAIDMFTTPGPVGVAIAQPGNAEFQTAEAALSSLTSAINRDEETSVEFSAADLNARIARDPSFAGLRGRAHVSTADSAVTLDLSVPLDALPFPGLKERWLSGTTRFEFNVALGQFVFAFQSATINGYELPAGFARGFSDSFSKSFNQSFQRQVSKSSRGQNLWRHIKTIAVDADKVIVATQRT